MRYAFLCFFACLLLSCNFSEKQHRYASLYNENLSGIDSLLQYERNKEARVQSFKLLNQIPGNDSDRKSQLYGYIGKSYLYSFHFDSAVYYTKNAYALSRGSNDRRFQAEQAAWLLKAYSRSEAYKTEREQLFMSVNRISMKTFDIPTRALVLNSLAEFYSKTKKHQLSLYVSSQELKLLKEDLSNRTANHKDSLNMALCYLRLSDPYLWESSFYLKNTTRYIEQGNVEKGQRYLLMARKWMGSSSYPLASYYHEAVYINSIKTENNFQAAASFRDSLVSLAKKTGHNFNDLIVQSNILISDMFFFDFLSKKNAGTDSCWKYFKDAVKYDTNLIDPVNSGYLQWLKGDLLLLDQKYDSALITFGNMAEAAKMFTLNQLITYNTSIADCHEKLGQLDSAIFYFKKYMDYTDSLLVVNEKEMIGDVESQHQYRVTQDKISLKNLIIKNVHEQRLWLFAVSAILLCLSVLLVIVYKNKRKAAIKLDKQNVDLLHVNEQLKEANQTKAKLFGIISHDFRAPISQIYQLFKLQQSQSALVKAGEKAVLEKQIRIATANLLDNMEDLLIWSKTQMLLFNIVEEPVDIEMLCNKCIDLLEYLIRDKQLFLTLHIRSGSVLKTDANFLLAILRNILHNAIKASPENSRIIIRFEQLERWNILTVINQGVSFTQEDYLEALHETHTSKLLTSGLGLMIIDELSRKIGAHVSFETIDSDHTCCKLEFPS